MTEAGGQSKHPCSICMEPMVPTEVHLGGSGCAHAFCRACLAGHVRANVGAGAAAVRCADASCAGALDPELCRAALPGDVFEQWCAALCESMFLGTRRTYCPFPNCSEMMVADDDDGGKSELCVMQSECQACWRLFCARCGVPWLAGVSCAEFERLGVGERCQDLDSNSNSIGSVKRGREDLLLLEAAGECKWKFYGEKSHGCLHITCMCGFEFCYGCAKPWELRHDGCPGE